MCGGGGFGFGFEGAVGFGEDGGAGEAGGFGEDGGFGGGGAFGLEAAEFVVGEAEFAVVGAHETGEFVVVAALFGVGGVECEHVGLGEFGEGAEAGDAHGEHAFEDGGGLEVGQQGGVDLVDLVGGGLGL